MDIGRRITYLREKKNLTVNKLANLAGVSQSYLRDIELGKKNPTVNFIAIICEPLDLSLKDFFNDDPSFLSDEDPLLQTIYQLTPEQKENLEKFLLSMLAK